MTEPLVSLAEVAVLMKGRWSVGDVERECGTLGVWLTEDWQGRRSITASAARSLVSGEQRAVFDHEQRQRKYQEATADWRRRQVAAGVAASERQRAEHVAAGRVADGESWSRQSAAAQEAYATFEKTEPKPRLE